MDPTGAPSWERVATSIDVLVLGVMRRSSSAPLKDGIPPKELLDDLCEIFFVLAEEGEANVIAFDEIDKAFSLLGSGTTNEIIDGWTIHFGLEM
ncbi:hypothetical protein Tco_0840613 [Tanacetum coccineum]|uniref:ATPase AAA-type core domain-containing protein n=1 Tax=Tanacetum coccineum TaxID=301880 RepID=A0ABQ5AYF0_9ASTR